MENEELVQHLGAAKDAQRQLTAEVSVAVLNKLEYKAINTLNTLNDLKHT